MLQSTVCSAATQLTRWHDHVCERKLAIWQAEAWHAQGLALLEFLQSHSDSGMSRMKHGVPVSGMRPWPHRGKQA